MALRVRFYLVYRFSHRPEIYLQFSYSLVSSPIIKIKTYIFPKEGLSLLGFVTRYMYVVTIRKERAFGAEPAGSAPLFAQTTVATRHGHHLPSCAVERSHRAPHVVAGCPDVVVVPSLSTCAVERCRWAAHVAVGCRPAVFDPRRRRVVSLGCHLIVGCPATSFTSPRMVRTSALGSPRRCGIPCHGVRSPSSSCGVEPPH